MSRLQGIGLHHRYGNVCAAAGIDIEVQCGEVVGLLGPNGAGKSTVLRLLAGLESPDPGTIRLDGMDITRWPLARRARAGLGYLPQTASVFPRLTVWENVALAVRDETYDVVGRVLEADGLLDLAHRRAGDLSGGQRRRVEIARCLALGARILLLDEPLAGLDPVHSLGIRARIGALAAAGHGVVITDHAVRETLPLCHRVIVIDRGKILFIGTPSEVVSDGLVRIRMLGEDFQLDCVPGMANGDSEGV